MVKKMVANILKQNILDVNCAHAHFVVIAGLHKRAELKKMQNK